MIPIAKRWPMLVVALLCTHVGLMMWAVTKCRSADNRVIPNYYEKALRYDAYKAEQAARAVSPAPTTRPEMR